ncbi:MAG: PqqD family protein [Algoriphagus sp.]|uniref:PqqD family protein n=1 Tax=Algoriphagus sp. TaxID=1872435 RepID=UPI001835EFF4|nr:PqqD family protein [Algoriphagus sp.]NVJ87806.1 PqqD family protein [Algoriphagus sp.]
MSGRVIVVEENRFLFTQLGEEGVLFDTKSNEYFNLNSTLTSIFNFLGEGLSLEELKAKLMEEYDVSEQQCNEDLEEAIAILKEKGLIYEKNKN